MTDETQLPPPEDEISLLNLLLVDAENARLLIFGPRLAGLAGLWIPFLIPLHLHVTATTCILPLHEQGQAAMFAAQR